MTWLLQYLHGYLLVQLSGFSHERFLNMCSANEIPVWDLRVKDGCCQFYITVKGFRKTKAMIKKTKVRLKILKKLGLPFFLYRNRRRKLYGAGFASFFLILYMMSLFIWDIEFEGNYKYTYDTLLKFCQSEEIYYGMQKRAIDCEGLEDTLRTQFPDITWVSARVSGTRLLVKIKENEVLSEIPVKDQSPCDLVADQEGVITSIIVRQGVPMVAQGDTVTKGQVLVSGTLPVIDDDETVVNIHYVHSEADINARTQYTVNHAFPLYRSVEAETGKVRKGVFLKVFSYSFLLMTPKPEGTTWNKIMEEEQLKLFRNFYLPVYVGRIHAKEFISYDRPYTEEEKKKEAEKINENFVKKLLQKGVHILENHVKILDNESLCQVTIDIVAEEPIGSISGIEIPMAERETTKPDERN